MGAETNVDARSFRGRARELEGGLWRHLSVLVIVLAVTAQASGESGPPNVHPLARISQEGFSFVAPKEDGWVVTERSGHLLVMGRAGRGPDETHAIRAGLSRLPSFETIEELTRIVRDQAAGNTDRQRFKVIKHEVAPHVGKETNCVQSHMAAEDHAVRRRSGKTGPMILEALILTCAHPKDRNVGVNVEYSQRYNPGEGDSRFVEKATQVLDSVEFTTL
jgi:hypothetical protein